MKAFTGKEENKRLIFLKSIRLLSEKNAKNGGSVQETRGDQTHKVIRQEEINLQKELEKRFDELFSTISGD
mgnify:CR=1